jgi:hypothetical protein
MCLASLINAWQISISLILIRQYKSEDEQLLGIGQSANIDQKPETPRERADNLFCHAGKDKKQA